MHNKTDKKPLLIFGTGTVAEVSTFYFNVDSDYEVVGYIEDDQSFIKEPEFLGKPIFKLSNVQTKFNPKDIEIFVAIGYQNSNKTRQQRYEMLKNLGYTFATYVSSRASVYTEIIGDNCFILEGNVLQPFVEVGNNVILWSGNHIGHHSTIGSHVFVASHVVISGKCHVGEGSFLGVNCCIHDGVTIGARCLVGAGAVVHKSCAADSLVRPPPSAISARLSS